MSHPWLGCYHKDTHATISIKQGDSVIGLFSETCKKYRGKEALSCLGVTLSFGEVDELANRFASFLQNEVGLKKGDALAIMIPNLIQFPIAFLGAMKIGVVCVNTNPLYTSREMLHQFKNSKAKAIVIIDMFVDKLEPIIEETDIKKVILTSLGDHLPTLKSWFIQTVFKFKGTVVDTTLPHTTYREALKLGERKPLTPVKVNLDDVALLQYTGGTTGISKGAMLTQANLLANVYQIHEWAKPFLVPGEETVLTALPLYHIFALSVNFLAFFTLGNKMLLLPKPVPIRNTVKLFRRDQVTVMTGVNTLYNALNNDPEFQSIRPKNIKVALAGGMALQKHVSAAFKNITGTTITEGFGLTEASPVTHCNPLHLTNPENSCGIPLPSTVAKIVDENGQEVKTGEVGELIIQGPQVMKGYWQNQEETTKVLRNGWLYTGDMCRMDEKGYFYIVDRKKDMILVSGFNVYPNEVEEVLASHPKVLEAAVIGVPDNDSGEAVKAFIVARDKSLTLWEVEDFCRTQLTGYKRPKTIEFRDELPKTNIGKILRRALK
ncbi:MAG: AMP-binding protein [Oligoflexales bacterium]